MTEVVGPVCFGASVRNRPARGCEKLAVLMGDDFFSKIAGKVIIYFGRGEGVEAIEMALRGAKRVIGIDIREDILQVASGRDQCR